MMNYILWHHFLLEKLTNKAKVTKSAELHYSLFYLYLPPTAVGSEVPAKCQASIVIITWLVQMPSLSPRKAHTSQAISILVADQHRPLCLVLIQGNLAVNSAMASDKHLQSD